MKISAPKLIFKEKYKTYETALNALDLETLEVRREQLCMNFALKCVKNERMKQMFPINVKKHIMNNREREKYKVQFATTARLQKSPIIYMQNLLNQHEKNKEDK